MNLVKAHPYRAMLAVCVVLLAAFMTLTNPEEVSVGVLAVPAVLTFFIIYSLAQLFFSATGILKSQPRKRTITAVISASLLTVVMILHSAGGLSPPDLILLGLIVVFSSVYINKY